jgi:type I restriction enzyme S subunit
MTVLPKSKKQRKKMTNYKRLGDYIQPVDERNTALEDLPLMGLSVSKEFFPTIANLVGTDMKTYKIVYKNQFTYIADTSRRGDKIAIALNSRFDKMLVSQAYTPFEVKNENELNPEYLMMWFRRPEFDRYARFKSHGSAREIFDWEEMCSVELPVPPIEKQREIVAEYNAVQKKIDLNNQLIQKLEETAQAIYKEWFVNFDRNEKVPLGNYIETNPLLNLKKGEIAKYTEMSDLSENRFSVGAPVLKEYSGGSRFQNNDTLLARITPCLENGKTGFVNYLSEKEIGFGSTEFIVIRAKSFASPYWIYCLCKDSDFRNFAISSMIGSSGRQRVHEAYLLEYKYPKIELSKMTEFHRYAKIIFKQIKILNSQNQKLTELQSLLLSKMATMENKKSKSWNI